MCVCVCVNFGVFTFIYTNFSVSEYCAVTSTTHKECFTQRHIWCLTSLKLSFSSSVEFHSFILHLRSPVINTSVLMHPNIVSLTKLPNYRLLFNKLETKHDFHSSGNCYNLKIHTPILK